MRSSRRCARDIDPPRYQAGRGYHGLLPGYVSIINMISGRRALMASTALRALAMPQHTTQMRELQEVVIAFLRCRPAGSVV
jgi:hypothetical protein